MTNGISWHRAPEASAADEADARHLHDIYGTDGNDTLRGTSADERFHPLLGGDDVYGGGGDDTLKVDYSDQGPIGQSASYIYVDGMGQYLLGIVCAGSSVFGNQISRVILHESSGDDYVNVAPSGVADSLIVDGGAGNDELFILCDYLKADTTIIHHHGALDFMGGHFTHFENFTIRLGSGNDYVELGRGDDPVVGGAGDDVLKGGGGDDYLVGGADADVVTGGSGADTFAFVSLTDFAASTTLDRITDFNQTQSDKIDLFWVDPDPNLAGDQAFTFIGTSAFTAGSSAYQLRYQVAPSGAPHGDLLVQGDVNHDGVADFQFLVHANALVASDFVL